MVSDIVRKIEEGNMFTDKEIELLYDIVLDEIARYVTAPRELWNLFYKLENLKLEK
jgi:predicted Zn-dependent peptidase